ncbi:extracellular calcium-sensing receptor-like [Lissotriton helveticus]
MQALDSCSCVLLWGLSLFSLMPQCSLWEAVTQTSGCALNSSFQESYYKEGDFMLGGVVHVYMSDVPWFEDYITYKDPWDCQRPSFRHLRHLLALIYAIEEINRNPNLLGNFTLGYQIYDSCNSVMKALQATFTILSKRENPVPNYSCQSDDTLVGFIGDLSSTTSFSIAQLLGIYRYPQISFGAMDPIFSNKLRFPSFYRTVPNDLSQMEGISQLLKHFSWSWVGILVPENDSGERALRQLMALITESGGCVEFFYMLPVTLSEPDHSKLMLIVRVIKRFTAQVIILYGSGTEMVEFYWFAVWDQVPPKVWVVAGEAHIKELFNVPDAWKTFNKIIKFSIRKGEIIGFKDFLHGVNPAKFPGYGAVDILWETCFECVLAVGGIMIGYNFPFCSGNESLQSVDLPDYDVVNFRYTFSVYTAVYALAHALHEMLESTSKEGTAGAAGSFHQDLKPWKVRVFQ